MARVYYRMVYPRRFGKLLVLGVSPVTFAVCTSLVEDTGSEGSSMPDAHLRNATREVPRPADGPKNSAVCLRDGGYSAKFLFCCQSGMGCYVIINSWCFETLITAQPQ